VYDDYQNVIGMSFKIVVLMRDLKDKETYDLMISVADQVLAEFRKKTHCTLGGLVHKFYIKGAIRFFVTGEGSTEMVGFSISTVAESLQSTL
jgi:hypothetical protein